MTRRHGFTLIEVLLAIVAGAAVALLAHEIFRAVTDARRTLLTAAAQDDVRAQARRWLSTALRSSRVSADSTFEGHATEALFTTVLPVALGRLEPSRVKLLVGPRGLVLAGAPTGSILLDPSAVSLRLDYLHELGSQAAWSAEWVSPVSLPHAVRLRVGRTTNRGKQVDTLLFLVGGPT
jgi:prepilin-type N-terminal cleavage/methylation domain-containing protein